MTELLPLTIFESALRGSVLIALIWAACTLLQRSSAAERHAAWVFALIGLLAMPLVGALAPRISLQLDASAGQQLVEVLNLQPAAQVLVESHVRPDAAAVAETDDAPGAGTATSALPSANRQVSAPQHSAAPAGISLSGVLTLFWSAGAALLGSITILRHLRVHRHIRNLSSASRGESVDRGLQFEVNAAARQMQLRRTVTALVCAQSSSPWTFGMRRPVLVVPEQFTRWSQARQHQAIVHELSHIARCDYLSSILAQVCCALYWFNPLVWLAARRRRLEAERACDDRVLNFGADAPDYAEQLVGIATRAQRVHESTVCAMARRSSLTPRIRSILKTDQRRAEMNKSSYAIASLCFVGLIVPLAALHSQPAALDDPQFVELLRVGPQGSAELETIVDTYADNGYSDAAADAAARFMVGDFGVADEKGCDFCIEVLASEATPRQHRHLPVLLSAFDLIEQRADESRSGDMLLNAVFRNAVGSGNRRSMTRANYFVMRALQIGVDPQLHLSIVQFLHETGKAELALDLAQRLYADERSPHYQSEDTQRWVVFLEGEMQREAGIARVIFESLGVDGDDADEEYLPIIKVAPVYPARAAAAQLEGSVVVEFTVDEQGKPQDVRVVSSSNSVFNDSAVAAAQRFRYTPRVVSGSAVAVPGVRNKITYALDL